MHPPSTLYYGDNLKILPEYMNDEPGDLDPTVESTAISKFFSKTIAA